MKWKKLGHIFCPEKTFDWMQSHASNPFAEHISDEIYRIYFSTRNNIQVSSIGYIDINLTNINQILNISTDPILSPGDLGTFDSDGVSLACILKKDDQTYLYYLGWNLCKTVPWNNNIGLAIKKPSSSVFQRYSTGPIIGRDTVDPLTISYPWIMQDNGMWKMWYGSHLKWGNPEKKENFLHALKYAESDDGITWKKNNKISIPLNQDTGEYAFAKPCVIRENGVYKMWYAYRGNAYKIGYAESKNGIDWERKDEEVGIEPSESGWDSEMMCYPFVFDHKGQRYMLYNGNGYGKTGFGLAVLT